MVVYNVEDHAEAGLMEGMDHLFELDKDILNGLVVQVERLAVDVRGPRQFRDRDLVDRLRLDELEERVIDILFGPGHTAVHRPTSHVKKSLQKSVIIIISLVFLLNFFVMLLIINKKIHVLMR